MSELLKNMSAQEESQKVKKSGYTIGYTHETGAKKEGKAKQWPKSDARYWKQKVFLHSRTVRGHKVEDRDYSARITFDGLREAFNTGESEKGAAASVAAEIYRTLDREGWEIALEKFKPGKQRRADVAAGKIMEPTLGEFFKVASDAMPDVRARTVNDYIRAFRHIAAFVGKIRGDASRFDYRTGGAEAWREKVDSLKLDLITPAGVQSWRTDFVKRAAGAPLKERSAKVSANTTLRLAKSLFSDRRPNGKASALDFIGERLALPSPLPFDGIVFFPKQGMKYQSKLNPETLLTAAINELSEAKPEHFKIFILGLCCGLRKNELDKLTWTQINFDAGTISIEPTPYFSPKTEDSVRQIDMDSQLVALMRGWKARTTGIFVIESKVQPRISLTGQHYRTQRIAFELGKWLKAHEISALKPLHELRKEAGSLMNLRHGIHAASHFLGHGDTKVTEQFYVSKKERLSLGLGAMLAPQNVQTVEFATPSLKASLPPRSKTKIKPRGA